MQKWIKLMVLFKSE